jgi:hypothetical protein
VITSSRARSFDVTHLFDGNAVVHLSMWMKQTNKRLADADEEFVAEFLDDHLPRCNSREVCASPDRRVRRTGPPACGAVRSQRQAKTEGITVHLSTLTRWLGSQPAKARQRRPSGDSADGGEGSCGARFSTGCSGLRRDPAGAKLVLVAAAGCSLLQNPGVCGRIAPRVLMCRGIGTSFQSSACRHPDRRSRWLLGAAIAPVPPDGCSALPEVPWLAAKRRHLFAWTMCAGDAVHVIGVSVEDEEQINYRACTPGKSKQLDWSGMRPPAGHARACGSPGSSCWPDSTCRRFASYRFPN